MLGIIPVVAEFAGLPRHPARHALLLFLTASVATLGVGALATKAFVLAVFGIAGIGIMNLAVSFFAGHVRGHPRLRHPTAGTPCDLRSRGATGHAATMDFFIPPESQRGSCRAFTVICR